MVELLTDFWESLTWTRIALFALALIVSIVISYAAVILVMVKIPADYFSVNYNFNHRHDRHFLLRWGATIFKNFVGVVLVLAGVIMLFGPGPGLLTILLGIIMLDIPGKRPLEASLIKRPTVLTAINRLRLRYNKPPLVVD